MRRMENLKKVCKYNTGGFCKRNTCITHAICYDHMPAPERGLTPRDLQGSEVTKDRGSVKTKTDKEKCKLILRIETT